jgi:hypothetical protein
VDPIDYLSICLDPVRLHALGAAAAGRATIDGVAEAMGVDRRTAVRAIGSLRASGLVDDGGRLVAEALREIGASLPTAPAADPSVLAGSWSDEETAVLATFFSGTRLSEIPASRGKRLVVLERLAQEFEPGVRYEERDVSFRLQMFHPDYAALRRYLVDEGFLTRAEGVYWRTGGRSYPGSAGPPP